MHLRMDTFDNLLFAIIDTESEDMSGPIQTVDNDCFLIWLRIPLRDELAIWYKCWAESSEQSAF